MNSLFNTDKQFLAILNQVFDIEQKLAKISEPNTIRRNLDRIKSIFEQEILPDGQKLLYHNPLGEPYNETRTDCEASISGDSTENLRIVEVIKPIIRLQQGDIAYILQKGVVVVKGS